MSLESQIGILTDAVRELTSALNSYGVRQHNAEVVKTVEAKRAPFVAQAASVLNPEDEKELPNAKSEETPQTTSPASEPTEPESAPVTYDDVKKVTIAVSKISKDKAVFGLNHFGVQTAKNLVEAQWADYIVFMNEVLEGKRYVD